jgi:hypothetical protein
MELDAAVEIVLRCAVRHRLPEPTRLADRLVARLKSAPGGKCPVGDLRSLVDSFAG